MKAVVIEQYGGPEVLKLQVRPDPIAGPGEVLVRVAATSINPIDYKRRSGAVSAMMPIQFPGVIGVDVAGTVEKTGPGVQGFAPGDRVLAMADQAYAELCVVKADTLVLIPDGVDTIEAAAIPLVATTGNMLIINGAAVTAGQTVVVTGAVGGVGRSAVLTAKSRGATVIAGVRKKQLADAQKLGADRVLALDDEAAVEALESIDAVADTVNGKTAAVLIAKVKQGGLFASVLGPPANAKYYPNVRFVPVFAKPDAAALRTMAQAVADGKLVFPIVQKFPLAQAAEGHAAAEKGGGKVLLLP